MKEILNSSLFWIFITLVSFEFGMLIYRKAKLPLLNPLLIAISLIITILMVFKIDYETYNIGGKFINSFLGPATVVLAVPLYKQLGLLKKNLGPILTGLLIGCASSVVSIILLGRIFKLDKVLLISLIPKSVTTPIGVEISKSLGGVTSVTILAIVLTGIVGAIIAPIVTKCLKLNNKVAIGIALGASAHALGTTKAFELGETEGAMSSLSIGVSGIITVIIAPIIYSIFIFIFS